jgi:predicted nucleic acid-binding protein
MLILDTDVLIDIQRGNIPAINWFAGLPELPVVPGFVAMELMQDAQNSDQIRQVQQLIAPLTIVWPSTIDCNLALQLFSRLHLSHRLGLIDSLIAATALGHNATLCTFNLKHYRNIEELKMLQPYQR